MTEMQRSALQISSGMGPLEARRFAAALGVHLEALALARGLAIEEVACYGDPGAPRSMTLYVRGDAVDALTDQLGTHQLLQRSAQRGRAARKRWFVAVSLHPIELPSSTAPGRLTLDDLEITACRAGGPGGQHVNKVATAVRVRHLPSGLSVRSSAARSQKANLDQAIRRLGELLDARVAAARSREVDARRLAHYRVERGRAIVSYSLAEDGALRIDGA